MPMNREALQERYQAHAVGMSNAMREAGEHIEANSQLDLTPAALMETIDDIMHMLVVARWHAERMAVYARLLSGKLD